MAQEAKAAGMDTAALAPAARAAAATELTIDAILSHSHTKGGSEKARITTEQHS